MLSFYKNKTKQNIDSKIRIFEKLACPLQLSSSF